MDRRQGTLTRWVGGRLENIEFPENLAAGQLGRPVDHWGSQRRCLGVHSAARRLPPARWRLDSIRQSAGVAENDPGYSVDRPADRVWFGYLGNQIALVEGDGVRSFSAPDGLHVGNVLAIGGRGDHIWAAGQLGLALVRWQQIPHDCRRGRRRLPGHQRRGGRRPKAISGSIWRLGSHGFLRAGIADRLRDPQHKLQYDLFDFRDGVKGIATQIRPLPSAVEAGDGRIWISGSNGVFWIDPAHIYKNPTPPPVTIEAIYEGDRRFSAFEASRLPKLPQNVRIEYTALSLRSPSAFASGISLEGYDRDWQDVGNAPRRLLPEASARSFPFSCNCVQ